MVAAWLLLLAGVGLVLKRLASADVVRHRRIDNPSCGLSFDRPQLGLASFLTTIFNRPYTSTSVPQLP